jgi:hypothetical protein
VAPAEPAGSAIVAARLLHANASSNALRTSGSTAEAVNPGLLGHYLRRYGWRLKLQRPSPGDTLFNEDATFAMVPSLSLTRARWPYHDVSFRSYNHPNNYIRHFDHELWLHEREPVKQFEKDASFRVQEAIYLGLE